MSIVTAISPRALIDVLFVLAASFRLVRQLAILYGGRPGALGMIALMRQTLAHLAITGSLAASDSLIQQVVGHGIAAKLSTRLGEGIVNGLPPARARRHRRRRRHPAAAVRGLAAAGGVRSGAGTCPQKRGEGDRMIQVQGSNANGLPIPR